MSVGAGIGPGNPLTRAVRERAPPIDTDCELHPHPRRASRHPRDETDVQLAGFVLEQADVNDDARRAQPFCTMRRRGIGVRHRGNDATNAGSQDGVDTRWRPPVMIAGLERHIKRTAARIASMLAHLHQRVDLGMRLAGTQMKAFTHHHAVLDDNTTDARVRRRRVETALRERERTCHVRVIGGAVVGHR